MGVAFSRPLSDFYELDSRLATAILRSLSFSSGGDLRTALRSLSFKGGTLGRGMVRSYGPGMIMVDGPSPRFKDRELDSPLSFHTPSADMENEIFGRPFSCRVPDQVDQLASWDGWSEKKSPLPGDHRYHAAVKLQKVYKSFRTRRQLADCAVVVEQKWWKLLDFAELKRSSISFFDIEKPETAVSRWSRAKRRAAKVGKGLSKDEKARKLALQHWLEAIDPRHRYGHNLQFYYAKWLHCQSKQPFFYWLDIGEGKEVNLERCPRSKLQQQCIKYLGPTERKAYAVVVEDGKFLYKPSGKLLDTRGGPKDAKWIFVLSTSKTLYVGQKNKGTFQHSSFLAGGATLSAGRLVVEDGVLKAVWPHSGHYLPTEENFQEFMSFLQEHNVDLTNVKKSPSEEEEENITYIGSIGSVRQNESSADSSEVSEATNVESLAENEDTRQQDSNAETNANLQTSKLSRGLRSKISRLEIPSRTDMFNIFMKEAPQPSLAAEPPNCPSDEDYESAEDSFLTEEDFMLTKATLFDEDEEEEEEEPIPKEEIIRRIVSHKGMKSYQLAEQLSSKWTTGAGPRIGCMRDYPSELQSRVLAQAKLSPRPPSGSSPRVTSRFSPRVLTPTPLRREATSRSSLAPDQRVLRQTATP